MHVHGREKRETILILTKTADGKLFKLSDPNGRVVEMPNGAVVEMLDGQVVE